MQKYSDIILNHQGRPVSGAVVQVTTYPSNTAATIYATDGGAAVASVTSDGNGRFAFYAADGHYNLLITGRGIAPITVTDVTLNDPANEPTLSAMASAVGSSLIGYANFGKPLTVEFMLTILSNGVHNVMDPQWAGGSDATGATDCTAAWQACANYTATNGGVFYVPRGVYLLDYVQFKDFVYRSHVQMDFPTIFGNASLARTALLDVVNCVNFNWIGGFEAYGSALYDSGLAVRVQSGTSQATTRVNIYNPTLRNFKLGIDIGRYNIDFQCSEMKIYGAHTFGCPTAARLGGLNTGVNFIGGDLVSERNVNYVGADEYAIIQEGGFISVTGGSIFTNPTGLYGVSFRPCQAGSGNVYGTFSLSGAAHSEVNSPLLKIENPRGLSSPVSSASSVAFNTSPGFCGAPAGTPFVKVADTSYVGLLDLTGNNWYSLPVRTAVNISCDAPGCRIKVDRGSMGYNFLNYLGGVVGGIILHDMVPVMSATGLSTTYSAGSNNVLKFLTNVTTNDLGRYGVNYVAATGIFTVPAGGLARVNIRCGIAGSVGNSGDFYVKKNGAPVAFGMFNGVGVINATLYGLVAGDTIAIQFAPTNAHTSDGGLYNYLQIEGAN